jgi:hypothetical protein
VALGALAVGWSHDRYPSRIDISAALPALMTALQDSDQHVRANAALDLGDMGSKAAPAVGRLIETLGDPDEGVRESVCRGLGGIGPAAKAALPTLWQALVDPSEFGRALNSPSPASRGVCEHRVKGERDQGIRVHPCQCVPGGRLRTFDTGNSMRIDSSAGFLRDSLVLSYAFRCWTIATAVRPHRF